MKIILLVKQENYAVSNNFTVISARHSIILLGTGPSKWGIMMPQREREKERERESERERNTGKTSA